MPGFWSFMKISEESKFYANRSRRLTIYAKKIPKMITILKWEGYRSLTNTLIRLCTIIVRCFKILWRSVKAWDYQTHMVTNKWNSKRSSINKDLASVGQSLLFFTSAVQSAAFTYVTSVCKGRGMFCFLYVAC